MSDTIKCTSDKCPKRDTCYRVTAPDSNGQSYANFYFEHGEDCPMYITINRRTEGMI